MGIIIKTKLSKIKNSNYFRLDAKYGTFTENNNAQLWNYPVCCELKKALKVVQSSIMKKGELEEEFPLIDLSNIERKTNNLRDVGEVLEIGSDKVILKQGDIVIPKIEPQKGQFFLNLNHNEYLGSTELVEYKINSYEFNPYYLFYILTSDKILKLLSQLESGTTHKRVSAESLLKIRIPKLPLEIQNQIALQIQPIETEITNLKNSKLKSLDIINQVFGEEFGFDWQFYKEFGKGMTAGTQQSDVREKAMYQVPLSQIAKSNILRISSRFNSPKTQFLNKILFSKPTSKIKNIITEKVHRGVSPAYNAEGEIPVVKTAHLKNGYLDISQEEFVTEEFYTKNIRSQIQQNDVLIASTGKVSLGKVDFVETDENLVIDGHISVIRIDETKYNALFLTYFLRSILGTFQIERDFTGATNQIELYSAEIEYFDIPDFSLTKQCEIVEKIKSQIDAQNVIDKRIAAKQEEINGIIEKAIA
jgi:type I restriction enzyme S subunit